MMILVRMPIEFTAQVSIVPSLCRIDWSGFLVFSGMTIASEIFGKGSITDSPNSLALKSELQANNSDDVNATKVAARQLDEQELDPPRGGSGMADGLATWHFLPGTLLLLGCLTLNTFLQCAQAVIYLGKLLRESHYFAAGTGFA